MSKTASRERQGKKVRDKRERDVFVARPFEGLPSETDWVAMREVLPAATCTVQLTEAAGAELAGTDLTLATVLPLTWPGLCTPDGRRMLALQSPARSGDLSRDLAQALELVLTAPPNHRVVLSGLPGPGPRLQDLIEPAALEIQSHPSFDFWLSTVEPADGEVTAGMKRANAVMEPTIRVEAAPSAYWCKTGDKAQLRWVLPWQEDAALQALSRIYAEDQLTLGGESRYLGAYRAHGLLIPVWDLPGGPAAADWEAAVGRMLGALTEAVASEQPLTAAERRARDGLRARQMTLR